MTTLRDMTLGELAALVCSHLKAHDIEVVLTGGACVTLYGAGQYVSNDLDFIERVSAGRRKLKAVLAAIGFTERDRYFCHPETKFFLEFPAGPLTVGGEPPGEIRLLTFSTGELLALSPTDCVKDRLVAFFHWNDLECFEQALLVANANEVDLAELERWAIKEGQGGKFARFKEGYAK
jgi:hypothetical protein